MSTVTGDFTRFGTDAPKYEYRQLIRGSSGYYPNSQGTGPFASATTYVYNVPGTPQKDCKQVLPSTDQEDGCGSLGYYRYGHRIETQECNDDYYDDSAHTKHDTTNGPYLLAVDQPNLRGALGGTGWVYLIDFYFTGKVVKVVNGQDQDICEITWHMYFKGPVPNS